MNDGTSIARYDGATQVLILSIATDPRLACNRLSVMSPAEHTCTQWFSLSTRMDVWAAPSINVHYRGGSNCLIASCPQASSASCSCRMYLSMTAI